LARGRAAILRLGYSGHPASGRPRATASDRPQKKVQPFTGLHRSHR
jgi:hypothetical protein